MVCNASKYDLADVAAPARSNKNQFTRTALGVVHYRIPGRSFDYDRFSGQTLGFQLSPDFPKVPVGFGQEAPLFPLDDVFYPRCGGSGKRRRHSGHVEEDHLGTEALRNSCSVGKQLFRGTRSIKTEEHLGKHPLASGCRRLHTKPFPAVTLTQCSDGVKMLLVLLMVYDSVLS